MSALFLTCAAAMVILTILVWLESLRRKDASIVDLIWGFGFAVVAWTAYGTMEQPQISRLLLPALVSFWGLRLSPYLSWRNHERPEDFRYQSTRKKWGDSFPIVSLLTVFVV